MTEVTYSYTDGQAVEDGILVEVSKIDRVTVAVWTWLEKHLPQDGPPPQNWPVDMLGWFGRFPELTRTVAAAKGLIGSHGPQARRTWDENIGGGVYELTAVTNTEDDTIVTLEMGESMDGAVLWLIPNEVGGITLMFPSDY